MSVHEFILCVQLPNQHEDPRVHAESLHRAGCNEDAIICYGIRGHIAFEFRRKANTMRDAQNKAWKQVQYAIPGVTLMDLDREVD